MPRARPQGSILARTSTTRSDCHVDRSRSPAPRAPEVRAPTGLPRGSATERSRRLRSRRRRSRGLLGRAGRRARVDRPVDSACSTGSHRTRSGSSAASSTSRSTASTGTSARARRNKAALMLGGRARRPPHAHLLGPVRRGQEVRATCCSSLGVKKGDRVAIYLPMIPEAAIAMLACARIGAIHSVVFGGFSPESLRDRINDSQCKVLVTADGGYRRGAGRSAQAQRRQGARGDARRSSTSSSCSAGPAPTSDEAFAEMKEGRDHWWHRLMRDAAMRVRARADGRRGRPVHPLHVGHDRQAEGHRPHDRRLPRRRGDDDASIVFDLKDDDVFWCTADVGWVTGHSYLVYGPLANGATCVMYEGAPDWPEKDRFWEICERLRRDDSLHRADGDSRVHEVGRPVAREARSLAPPPARLRRRADQSRSVDVVSRAHRRQSLPDRRHVVADRDGRDRDLAAARASPRRNPAARRRRSPATAPRFSTRTANEIARRRRTARAHEAVAVDAAHDLGRRRALRARRTSRSGPAVPISTSPATAPSATRTATSGSSAASTTCSTSPATASARWKSRSRARRASRGRRGGGGRQVARAQGTGDRRVRDAARGLQARATSCARSCASSSPTRSARSRGPTTSCSRPICRRRARARSCGACCATSPKAARSAIRRRSPIRTSSTRLKEQYEAQES